MAAQKRTAGPDSSSSKRTRVSEPTAAASRPRRAANPEPVAEPKPEPRVKSASKAKASKQDEKPDEKTKPTKTEAVSTKPEALAKTAKAPATKQESAERKPGQRCFWLMKAEPESRLEKGIDVKFSIHDLAARTKPEPWDGVRNPVAQKNMRSMRKGDLAFFYHSNCKVPGIAGLMEIVGEEVVDESAFDPKHPYYDPKSSQEKPRWCVVHVKHVATFEDYIPLKILQKHAVSNEPLATMQVLKMSRLSVSKVSTDEWNFILKELAGKDGQAILAKSKD